MLSVHGMYTAGLTGLRSPSLAASATIPTTSSQESANPGARTTGGRSSTPGTRTEAPMAPPFGK